MTASLPDGSRPYLGAYFADRLGDGLFYTALAWVAAQTASSVGATAVLAAGSVPRVAMLLAGGWVADRWGLRRTVLRTLAARAALMGIFGGLLLVGGPSAWLLGAVALLFGAVDALHGPAFAGLSVAVAPGREAVRLQGFMASIGNVVEVVGAPVAGVLLAWRGDIVGWVGIVLVIAAAVLTPRAAEAPRDSREEDTQQGPENVWRGMRRTLRMAGSGTQLHTLLLLVGIVNFAATAPVVAGVPLLATHRGWSSTSFGLVMAGYALGGIVGGLSLARWGRGLQRPVVGALLLLVPGGAALVTTGLVDAPAVCAALMFVASAVFAIGGGALIGRIKAGTEPGEEARAMALVQMAVFSLIPLGLLAYGAMATWWSAAAAQTAMGTMVAVVGVAGLLRPQVREIAATPARTT